MKRFSVIFLMLLTFVLNHAQVEESYPESYNDYADYTDASDTSVATKPTPLQTTVSTTTAPVTTTVTTAPILTSVPSNGSVINYLKPQQQNFTQRMPNLPINGQIPRFTQTNPPQRFPQINSQQPKNQLPQTSNNSFRTGGLKEIAGKNISQRNAQEIKRQQEKVKKIAARRLKNLKKKIQKQNQQKGQPKSKIQSSSKRIMNHF